MGQNLTVHYNRMMYLVEPTDDQKALRGKRIDVTESADGTVRLWYASKELTATPFAKDGRVTQQDVADNKLLGSVLEHIRKEQIARDEEALTKSRTLKAQKTLQASLTRQAEPPVNPTSLLWREPDISKLG